METVITIKLTHSRPLAYVGELVAGRAYTIAGVTDAELLNSEVSALSKDENGLTAAELALGATEVHRS